MLRLHKDWQYLHKAYSVIFSSIGFLISLTEVILPSVGLLQPVLSPETYGTVMFALTVLTLGGRYIQQDLKDGKLDGKSEDTSTK